VLFEDRSASKAGRYGWTTKRLRSRAVAGVWDTVNPTYRRYAAALMTFHERPTAK
jgi:hypothetical protein